MCCVCIALQGNRLKPLHEALWYTTSSGSSMRDGSFKSVIPFAGVFRIQLLFRIREVHAHTGAKKMERWLSFTLTRLTIRAQTLSTQTCLLFFLSLFLFASSVLCCVPSLAFLNWASAPSSLPACKCFVDVFRVQLLFRIRLMRSLAYLWSPLRPRKMTNFTYLLPSHLNSPSHSSILLHLYWPK